jgi:hypothetical protein
MATGKSRVTTTGNSVNWKSPLHKDQFVFLGISIGVIVVGFVLLSLGMFTTWDNPLSVDVAPVVLVIGYCILVPLAIMRKSGFRDRSAE